METLPRGLGRRLESSHRDEVAEEGRPEGKAKSEKRRWEILQDASGSEAEGSHEGIVPRYE